MYLFNDYINDKRMSELRSDRSKDGIYSITLSSHDIQEATYFISVRCHSEATRFRAIVIPIRNELEIDHPQHGEICMNDW